MACTDFAKAFDKGDHGVITHKIMSVDITEKVGKWICSFLINRTCGLVLNNTKSSFIKVKISVTSCTVMVPPLNRYT